MPCRKETSALLFYLILHLYGRVDVECSQLQRDEGDLTNIETESYEENDVMEIKNTRKEVKNSSPESISVRI